jgi:hypothetical protein
LNSNSEFFTLNQLKTRGWTEAAIARFLGPGDLSFAIIPSDRKTLAVQ